MGEKSKVLFSLFGVLDVTGEVVGMWAVLVLITALCLVIRLNLKERPNKLQNMVEAGIDYLTDFFSDALGKEKARKYFCFLSSLFVFIIFSNYSGLIPGMGLSEYIKAPTSSFSVTIGLGVVAFCFLQYSGLRHSAKNYFKRFVSPMFFMLPLLLLDEIVKPLSLSLRLFGNVFGEETVTEKLYEILPIGAPVIMMALSILFCALQAIVFTMLVSIYLDEVTETEEEDIKRNKEK